MIIIEPPAQAPLGTVVEVENEWITGTTTLQEYTTNNGSTWYPAENNQTHVRYSLNKDDIIKLRVKATATAVASAATAPIRVVAAPTGIGLDIGRNLITGTSDSQEYRTKIYRPWLPTTQGATSYMFVGGEDIQFRNKVTDNVTQSLLTSIIHVENPAAAPLSVRFDYVNNFLTNTSATQEYSIDNGLTWKSASNVKTPYIFVGGESIKVRLQATANKVASNSITYNMPPAAAAPSGISIDAVQKLITNTTNLMEFSTNNGTSWTTATNLNTPFTFVGGEVIQLRFKATADNVASLVNTINVPPAAAAPAINVNVAGNQITGTTTLQEYSLNNGTSWTTAKNGSTPFTFVGGESIQVRIKATVNLVASAVTVINVPLAANAPSGISVNVAEDQITGTTALQEYTITDGTFWSPAAEGFTPITFLGGEKVKVRIQATKSALASTATATVTTIPLAAAPQGIKVNVTGNLITGTHTSQEYTTNNGISWTDASEGSSSYTFIGGEVVKVRFKATTITPASKVTAAVYVQTSQQPAPTGITVNVLNSQILGTTEAQEYTTNGVTWTDASTGTTFYKFIGGEAVQVRKKATSGTVASLATAEIHIPNLYKITGKVSLSTLSNNQSLQAQGNVSIEIGSILNLSDKYRMDEVIASQNNTVIAENGQFTISGVPAGNYGLIISAEGYSRKYLIDVTIDKNIYLEPVVLTAGDIDQNGIIDDADLQQLISKYNGSSEGFSAGDFDRNGFIDAEDLKQIIKRFGLAVSEQILVSTVD